MDSDFSKTHEMEECYRPRLSFCESNQKIEVEQGQKFILDCDPGGDAEFMAKKYNHEILGLTTSYGNSKLEHTTRNAQIALNMVDSNVPIYKGCQDSMLQEFYADGYFGEDGISQHQKSFENDQRSNIQEEHAIDFIIRSVKKYPYQVNIIITGPATNLAAVIMKCPEVKQLVQCVYFMGGSYLGQGNTTNFVSEFNAFNDPHAFHVVLKSFRQVVLLPFDSIFGMQPKGQDYKDIFQSKTKIGDFLQKVYELPSKGGQKIYLCDPIIVAIAMNINLISAFHHKHCKVELEGKFTKGQLIVDWMGTSKIAPNVFILIKIDEYLNLSQELLFRLVKEITL